MAVLIEANSVIIKADAVINKFQGGLDAFEKLIPNNTMCADGELIRVGFMEPADIYAFTEILKKHRLEHLDSNDKAIDFVLADQLKGFTSHCEWAQFGRVSLDDDNTRKVAAARMINGESEEIFFPDDWHYNGSLSQTYAFSYKEDVERSFRYLRREKGVDVYLNTMTGEEMYVGRTER
jgi:hypothetical protein